jgi:catechol 2,3-dioxygenase-like lactoylglutathione lyase family enzyme
MSTKPVRTNDPTSDAGVARVAMKFEVVVIPVSDVDRAKEFYRRLGWRLDADYDSGKDFRVIQFTPPGSGCSIIFGKNVTPAAPGSAQGLYLIVCDVQAARKELLDRGVEISFVPRSGRQRLAVPGNHCAAARPHRPRDHDLRVGQRSGERASACGCRARAARGADWASRPELAGLVRRVHGARAGRRSAAAMNE